MKEGDRLTSNDLIEVELSIDAKNNFEYLVFEEPKPAGCEPVNLQSGYQWGEDSGLTRNCETKRSRSLPAI